MVKNHKLPNKRTEDFEVSSSFKATTNSNDKTVLNIYRFVASDVSNSGMLDEKIQTHEYSL